MNFYSINKLDYFTKSSFIDLSLLELDNFLTNSSNLQKTKFKAFKESELLQYCLIFIKIDKHLKHFPYNLFDISCSDFNKYDKDFGTALSEKRTTVDLLRDKEIETFNSIKEDSNINAHFFTNMLQELGYYDIDVSCSYMFYKQGACISTHQHNPDTIALHVLLEDIKDGGLEVTVNNETKCISLKGEYVMIETMNSHSAIFTGMEGKVLSFGFSKSNLTALGFLN